MRALLLTTILTLLMSVVAQANKIRTFTNKEGQKIEASVVGINSSYTKVTLLLTSNNRKFVFPIHKLSDEDQKYVGEIASKIAAQKDLFISVKEQTLGSNRKDGEKKTTTEKEKGYLITLRNGGSAEMDELTVKYKLYTRKDNGDGKKDTDIVTPGSFEAKLKAGSSMTHETYGVTLSSSSKEKACDTGG